MNWDNARVAYAEKFLDRLTRMKPLQVPHILWDSLLDGLMPGSPNMELKTQIAGELIRITGTHTIVAGHVDVFLDHEVATAVKLGVERGVKPKMAVIYRSNEFPVPEAVDRFGAWHDRINKSVMTDLTVVSYEKMRNSDDWMTLWESIGKPTPCSWYGLGERPASSDTGYSYPSWVKRDGARFAPPAAEIGNRSCARCYNPQSTEEHKQILIRAKNECENITAWITLGSCEVPILTTDSEGRNKSVRILYHNYDRLEQFSRLMGNWNDGWVRSHLEGRIGPTDNIQDVVLFPSRVADPKQVWSRNFIAYCLGAQLVADPRVFDAEIQGI